MKKLMCIGTSVLLAAIALLGTSAAASNAAPVVSAASKPPARVVSAVAPATAVPISIGSTTDASVTGAQQSALLPTTVSVAATSGFNPANVQTVAGSQQPVRTTTMSNGRTLRYYTAQGEEMVTHEKCVIISIQRGTNTWWDRRIVRFKDLNELHPCAAEGGCMTTEPALRSFLGGLFDAIRGAVQSLANALTGAAHQFADLLRQVGQLFTGWGKRLTDAANTIDKNAAGFYAKAVSDVAPNATMLTHVKLQRVWNKAIDLDPSGKTALVLATATLNMP